MARFGRAYRGSVGARPEKFKKGRSVARRYIGRGQTKYKNTFWGMSKRRAR